MYHYPSALLSSSRKRDRKGHTKRPAKTPFGIKPKTCWNGEVINTRPAISSQHWHMMDDVQRHPWARFDNLCSTTAIGTSRRFLFFSSSFSLSFRTWGSRLNLLLKPSMGDRVRCIVTSSDPRFRISRSYPASVRGYEAGNSLSSVSLPDPAEVESFSSSQPITVNEEVWSGAWGIRPICQCLSYHKKWGGVPFEAGSPRIPDANRTNPSKKKSQWNPGGFRNGNSDPWAINDYTVSLQSCGGRHTETLWSK